MPFSIQLQSIVVNSDKSNVGYQPFFDIVFSQTSSRLRSLIFQQALPASTKLQYSIIPHTSTQEMFSGFRPGKTFLKQHTSF